MWIEPKKLSLMRIVVAISILPFNYHGAQSQSLDLATDSSDFPIQSDLASVDWIHGAADCEALANDPDYIEWQPVQFAPQTFVIRQNKCSNYEGPFVYLFIGDVQALLIDSGATVTGGLKLVETVRSITDLPVLLAHSHGHGDHRLGDDAFKSQDDMSVVGIGSSAVQQYFGFANWPNEPISIDLGARPIQMLPIPGHNDDDLAFYDAQSRVVVTGDTLYPGRLYVRDWLQYKDSIARLDEWVKPKAIDYVLGTHIEMTSTPNVDYPIGTTFQPDEHQLPLSINDINLLRETLDKLESAERTPLGSFIIWPTQ